MNCSPREMDAHCALRNFRQGDTHGQRHGLVNYIDTKAKCRHLKFFSYKEILRQVFICLKPPYLSEVPSPLWPHPPPPYILYTCMLCTYSHREGGRGGDEPERRLEGQQFTKLGRKYQHDWLYLQSINSDKHLPQSPCTGNFFLYDDFLLWCLYR